MKCTSGELFSMLILLFASAFLPFFPMRSRSARLALLSPGTATVSAVARAILRQLLGGYLQ